MDEEETDTEEKKKKKKKKKRAKALQQKRYQLNRWQKASTWPQQHRSDEEGQNSLETANPNRQKRTI